MPAPTFLWDDDPWRQSIARLVQQGGEVVPGGLLPDVPEQPFGFLPSVPVLPLLVLTPGFALMPGLALIPGFALIEEPEFMPVVPEFIPVVPELVPVPL